jgi:antitoxin CptB
MLWRCRRGLLELDIVLQRFIETSHEQLDQQQLTALEELLDYPDNDLWDLVTAP